MEHMHVCDEGVTSLYGSNTTRCYYSAPSSTRQNGHVLPHDQVHTNILCSFLCTDFYTGIGLEACEFSRMFCCL